MRNFYKDYQQHNLTILCLSNTEALRGVPLNMMYISGTPTIVEERWDKVATMRADIFLSNLLSVIPLKNATVNCFSAEKGCLQKIVISNMRNADRVTLGLLFF